MSDNVRCGLEELTLKLLRLRCCYIYTVVQRINNYFYSPNEHFISADCDCSRDTERAKTSIENTSMNTKCVETA